MKIEELRKRAEEAKERLRILNEIYEAECLIQMIEDNRELIRRVAEARDEARRAKLAEAEAKEVLRRTVEECEARKAARQD